MSDNERDKIRMEIEDAVTRAFEAGWARAEIEAEVAYAIATCEDDS